jgi:hypothetical protein
MLYAFIEGLCGIVDENHSFRRVRCAPRWVALGEETATVDVSYAASGAKFGYDFRHHPDQGLITLTLRAQNAAVDLHLLLPPGAYVKAARRDGAELSCETVVVEDSAYADIALEVDGRTNVEVHYDGGGAR